MTLRILRQLGSNHSVKGNKGEPITRVEVNELSVGHVKFVVHSQQSHTQVHRNVP